MKRVTPAPTCILTDENIATEDDCTTHDHEPCGTCDGFGRHYTTFEENPTALVDIGPCLDCVYVDTRTGVRTVAAAIRALDDLHNNWADQDGTEEGDLTGEEFDEREIALLRDLYELVDVPARSMVEPNHGLPWRV